MFPSWNHLTISEINEDLLGFIHSKRRDLDSAHEKRRHIKVRIIGAGIMGVILGYVLKESGFPNVTIYDKSPEPKDESWQNHGSTMSGFNSRHISLMESFFCPEQHKVRHRLWKEEDIFWHKFEKSVEDQRLPLLLALFNLYSVWVWSKFLSKNVEYGKISEFKKNYTATTAHNEKTHNEIIESLVKVMAQGFEDTPEVAQKIIDSLSQKIITLRVIELHKDLAKDLDIKWNYPKENLSANPFDKKEITIDTTGDGYCKKIYGAWIKIPCEKEQSAQKIYLPEPLGAVNIVYQDEYLIASGGFVCGGKKTPAEVKRDAIKEADLQFNEIFTGLENIVQKYFNIKTDSAEKRVCERNFTPDLMPLFIEKGNYIHLCGSATAGTLQSLLLAKMVERRLSKL